MNPGEGSSSSSRPGGTAALQDHDQRILSDIHHILLEDEDSGHAAETPLALRMQEFGMLMTPHGPQQQHQQEGGHGMMTHDVPPVSMVQEPAALHIGEAIEGRGIMMPQQQQQPIAFYRNYGAQPVPRNPQEPPADRYPGGGVAGHGMMMYQQQQPTAVQGNYGFQPVLRNHQEPPAAGHPGGGVARHGMMMPQQQEGFFHENTGIPPVERSYRQHPASRNTQGAVAAHGTMMHQQQQQLTAFQGNPQEPSAQHTGEAIAGRGMMMHQQQQPRASYGSNQEHHVAQHTQGTVAPHGMMMPQQQQQPGSFYGSHFIPPAQRNHQEPGGTHALQAPQAIPAAQGLGGLGSYYGVPDYGTPFSGSPPWIGIQEPATASHALQPQQATAAVQGMPQPPQQQGGLGSSSYGIHSSVPDYLPLSVERFPYQIQSQNPYPSYALQDTQGPGPSIGGSRNYTQHDFQASQSFQHPNQDQGFAAWLAQPFRPSIAADGSFPGPTRYVAPDAAIVPSIQHLIRNCNKPFEKKLTKRDLELDLWVNRHNAEELVLPLLNANDNATEGIMVTTYDGSGHGYPMWFRAGQRSDTGVDTYGLGGKGWRSFISQHRLQELDIVTLWAFKHAVTEKLCFVMISRRPPRSTAIGDMKRPRDDDLSTQLKQLDRGTKKTRKMKN